MRIVRWIGSLRLTLVLIVALCSVFLLGLWIPQKGVLKRDLYLQWKSSSPDLVAVLDSLGFTSIYTSPITLLLWALFFMNLTLVMWQRVSGVRKRIVPPDSARPFPLVEGSYQHHAVISLDAARDPGDVLRRLRANRYRTYGTAARFAAVKNRLAPVATLFFHLSFFLILAGGAVSFYTRFAATVDLAEGESFTAALDRYNATPRLPRIGTPPSATFTVDRIIPVVEEETPVGLSVRLVGPGEEGHDVEINSPYKVDSTSFVIQNLGVAPLIILTDRVGRELDGAYVKLNVLKGRRDVFSMQGLHFDVDFFPDYVVIDGRESTRSLEVKNPAFLFHIQENDAFVARRIVRPGGSIEFAAYRLRMPEMRYWVRFYVVKEHGVGIMYAGFGTATAALIWRLLFYRREIIGAIDLEGGQRVLRLAGRAEFYKALFEDEFHKVVSAVRAS